MNANAHDRSIALAELVRSRLPAEFDVPGDHAAWPMLGNALLSRMTGTLDSVFRLQPTGRGADAMTLTRSLYDFTVHFAWLGADPSAERVGQWRRYDLSERLAADNDTKTVGVELLTPARRTAMEAERDALPGVNKLYLANLAGQADDYWEPRIEELQTRHEVQSFRGLYATAYRLQSGVAHGSERALHPVIEDITATRKRVKLEDGVVGRGPYGMATTIYALGLLVSEHALGWPTRAEIDDVFARHPG